MLSSRSAVPFLITGAAVAVIGCGDPWVSGGLSLEPPVRIEDAGYWMDEATLYARLVDARGNEVAFCVDGRRRSRTQGRIFIGGTHPSDFDTEIVPVGSDTEHDIIEALQAWLDERYSRPGQKELMGVVAPWTLSGDEANAVRLLHMIRAIQEGRRGPTQG